MSYRFSVDLTALQHAADGVGEVLYGGAEFNLTQLPTGADVVGDSALADVLGDFCSRWQRGVADLVSEGQQIASRLNYLEQNPGKIARITGYTTRQIKDAIHAVKNQPGWRGLGGVRNPDVFVDLESGDVYPQTPDDGPADDSIGNIYDYLERRGWTGRP